jgi:hypothetical protein
MKVVVVVLVLSLLLCLGGCQTDIIGPSASMKVMYKGENGDNEYLSRGSGMSGGAGHGQETSFSFGSFGKK